MLEVFRAIEDRDVERFTGLCQPDVEFVWPPTLPYGRATTGLDEEIESASSQGRDPSPNWLETWDPLQPTSESRRMDPTVVGSVGDTVVVLWHQRGVDHSGRRIDEAVLGLYEISDAKLARGQMFYFDPGHVAAFLATAAA
jgi:ketosteroid isomerase-like protein